MSAYRPYTFCPGGCGDYQDLLPGEPFPPHPDARKLWARFQWCPVGLTADVLALEDRIGSSTAGGAQ